MRLRFIFVLLWIAFFLPNISLASPDEATGTVTSIFDGDTFEVRIETSTYIAPYTTKRINLADVDSPEINTVEGVMAKSFTSAILLNKTVWLDIDNRSLDRDSSGEELACVVYLAGMDQRPIPFPSFNKILVDSRNAVIEDFEDNEFNPYDWWIVDSHKTAGKEVADSEFSPYGRWPIDELSLMPEFLITDNSLLLAETKAGSQSSDGEADENDDDDALKTRLEEKEEKIRNLEEENAKLKQEIKELKEKKESENKEEEPIINWNVSGGIM